jgi:integrase
MWRTLLLTGIHFGELLALRKSDLTYGPVRDESSDDGRPSTTKNKKTHYAPIPDSLRGELEDWNKAVEGELIFPNAIGFSRQFRYARFPKGRAGGAPHLSALPHNVRNSV